MSKVCGDCWADLRPTEYEPNTFIVGDCDRCGDLGRYVHRVRREELLQNPIKGQGITPWDDEPYQTEEQARGRRDLRPQS